MGSTMSLPAATEMSLTPCSLAKAFSHARSKRLAAASGISGALASISSRRAATSSTVEAEASLRYHSTRASASGMYSSGR